jgi:5'-nucleotidase
LRILLTNDDGIDAEGLQCLAAVLAMKAECFVVAPDTGRSCCSHGVTTGSPLTVVAMQNNQWSVSGTPADCVRVGLLCLNLKPDLVVSGVNHGGNLGVDILYSGTAAGAREASLFGLPAIAVSQYMRRDLERDWNVNALRAAYVIENILTRVAPGQGFWNVNLPALPIQIAGHDFPISRCQPEPQSLSFAFEDVTSNHPLGPKSLENLEPSWRSTVVYKSNYQERPRNAGSDVDLCFTGHATISWFPTTQVGSGLDN